MSKVALILTGHLRYKPDENIGFSINVLNSLFPNSEVEIFLSTYDDLGYFQNNYKDYTNFKTPWISSENSSINLINELNDKYNFKYLNVENFKNQQNSKHRRLGDHLATDPMKLILVPVSHFQENSAPSHQEKHHYQNLPQQNEGMEPLVNPVSIYRVVNKSLLIK